MHGFAFLRVPGTVRGILKRAAFLVLFATPFFLHPPQKKRRPDMADAVISPPEKPENAKVLSGGCREEVRQSPGSSAARNIAQKSRI